MEAGAANNLAMTDAIAQAQFLAPTENALQVAGANPKAPQPRAQPQRSGGGGTKVAAGGPRNALIPGPPPPPPPANPKIIIPPVPSKNATAPKSVPTVADAAPEVQQALEEAAAAEDAAKSPEEKRKEELMADPNFKKYVTALKMKVPLVQIR